MAKEKFRQGDTIRLTKRVECGTLKLSPATEGKIERITKKVFGKDEYLIRIKGYSITFFGTGSFVLAQVDDSSGVSKG